MNKTGRAVRPVPSGCRKSPWTFSTAFQNAVTFAPHGGAKVLAPLAASLAGQGIAGHSIPCEAGGCPLALPRPGAGNSVQPRFFDTLTGRAVRPVPFQAVEKVAEATFSKELHEIFASISDEIVGKNFMRSVIFEAHVPENDGFSFDSVI